jgi:hypothetical protein
LGGTRRDGLHQIDRHCPERIDLIARKTRDLAREHGVSWSRTRCSCAPHGTVEVDQEIPPERYRAGAKIAG